MIIGRKEEIELLQKITKDDRSHFVAVYGRRRVGKTFLIRESYDYKFTRNYPFTHFKCKDILLLRFTDLLLHRPLLFKVL